MSNANSSTRSSQIITTRIEVRFASDGKFTACAFAGTWFGDEDNVRQIATFRRGNHQVRLMIYNAHVTNVREWGKWLVAALIDRDERVWQHVDLSVCSR